MSKNILIIGGTRLFGKLLVQRLMDAGHRLTLATRGLTPEPFGGAVKRLRVDRRDRNAMCATFAGNSGYDVIFDQMCYNPLDAALAAEVFHNKTARYVLASTLEVYRPYYGVLNRPFVETDILLDEEPIDIDFPWHAQSMPEGTYSQGKRQAEAFFQRDGRLPVVSVRIAHVLAGPEDFTGRLAHYVAGVLAGTPLAHSATPGKTSFISAAELSRFMAWVGDGTFLGALNTASRQDSVLDLQQRIGAVLARVTHSKTLPPDFKVSQQSPFDFSHPYSIDTQRAQRLGFRYTDDEHALDSYIRQHAAVLTPALEI